MEINLEEKILPLVENVIVSKNNNNEMEIELEFKKEQSEEEIKNIKKYVIELLKNIN